jgi:PASTA domain/Phosphoesterase family
VVAIAATLAFSVSAMATTAATDLPTQSSAYNAAWQPAPTGYTAPSNDGFGAANKINHVWVIVLENHAYDSSFTPLEGTQNSYLEQLPSQGALLTNYYGTGHSSLDNYLSIASGQAPLPDTQDDCPSYDSMSGTMDTSGTPATNSDYGQFVSAAGADAPPNDNGCVYPSDVKTIFNQLDGASKSWKVYAQDLSATGASGQNAGVADCGAPESTVGAAPTSGSGSTYELNDGSANSTDQYVPKHNPLPWFDSMLPTSMGGTGGSDCSNNLAPLLGSSDQLNSDLQSASTTPDLSLIVPDNCSNGHDAVCAGNNLSGEGAGYPTYNTASTIPAATNSTGGTYAESQFLSIVVPEIEASPAFQDNGMIVVTYDEAYPPFTYSNDSQANSQLQNPDAAGSLTNDAAGETLYGRSLSWEPTGPNATIVTAPSGQVLTAGPGDSAYLDRPTSADGDLVACNEPTLDPTGGSGNDNWVTFTAPTGSNGDCIPGFQANGYRPATKTTPSLTITSGSSTVPDTAANDEIQGMQVTSWSAGTPTLTDGANNNYTGNVYVGSVADTPQAAANSSSAAFTGAFTLVDTNGSPVTVNSGYAGTITLTAGDTSTDPFYDAFDATLGGGDSGAVLISPYITPGTVSNTYYNHYSLLRTLEDALGLQDSSVNDTGATGAGAGYLGFASQPGLAPFGSDVFTNVSTPTTTQTVTNTTTVTQTTTVSSPGGTTTVTTPGGTTTVTTPGNTRTVTEVKSVVPYLSGETLGRAKSAISADKLKLGNVKGSGTVASESPRAGTVVKTGTKVSLTLRK